MHPGRLRNLRNEANKTQKQMAAMFGITRQGYGSYENGITEPDNETLTKLADYFDVTIDYLMGRTNERRRNKNESASALSGSELDRIISATESHFKVNLRDDPVVLDAMKQLAESFAKMKQGK